MPPDGPESRLGRAGLAAAACVVLGLGLQIASVWAQIYPPLLDLPNHAARHSLESRWLTGGGVPAYYSVRYGVLPNLGADLTPPWLMAVLPPLAACKLYLSFCLVLAWLGPTVFLV